MTGDSSSPLVSVVIPSYNRAGFLRRTIDSVLDQDYGNIECIVMDGASTDGSIDVLRSYGDRIRWVSEPDRGHAHAINKGWRSSHGEILAWLNADDMWAVPDAARVAVSYFGSHPSVDMVYGDTGLLDVDGRIVGVGYSHSWDLAYAVENCDPCIPQAAAFIRRSILERVGWLDERFYQGKDHELWLRIGLAGTIAYIPEILAHTSIHEGLTFQGPSMAASRVQIARRFFSLPNISPAILARKRRAMSNAYLAAADHAWVGGRHAGLMALYATRAVLVDPGNIGALAKRLLEFRRRLDSGGNSGRSVQVIRGMLALAGAAGTIPRTVRLLAGEGSREMPRQVALEMATIEQGSLAASLPERAGKLLVAGPRKAAIALAAAERGMEVTALEDDVTEERFIYAHPRLRFAREPFAKLTRSTGHFDTIVCIDAARLLRFSGPHTLNEAGTLLDDILPLFSPLLASEGHVVCTVRFQRAGTLCDNCSLSRMIRAVVDKHGFELLRVDAWAKFNRGRWIAIGDTPLMDAARSDAFALGIFRLKRISRA